ncbi:MAG TPA: GGDEF domain-containing protein [Blastocatellia bacterium]|nr:GGDEF domain-containing protein [Blastocatellia bacterium]
MMPNSFSEILQQERMGLLFSANKWLERSVINGGKIGLEELQAAERSLRQSVDNVLKRHAEGITKDELVELQSSLHKTLDECFQRNVKDYCDRRFQTLMEQARRDSLTGLLNRAAFEDRMSEEVARAKRYGRHLTVVMFDVDDFKSVNDRQGHQAGDRVLVHVARLLQASFRLSDPVFRYGGDEFVALCPETAGAVIENALKRIESQQTVLGSEDEFLRNVKISWGVASLPTDAVSAFDLIQIADQRLYQLKRNHHRQSAGKP